MKIMKMREIDWILFAFTIFCVSSSQGQNQAATEEPIKLGGPLAKYLHVDSAYDFIKRLKQTKTTIFDSPNENAPISEEEKTQKLFDQAKHAYGLGGTYEFLVNAVSITDDKNKELGVNSDHWPPSSIYKYAQDEKIQKLSNLAKAALVLPEDIHAKFVSTSGSYVKSLADLSEDKLSKVWMDPDKQQIERSNHFNSHLGKLFHEGKYAEAISLSIKGYEIGLKELFTSHYLQTELTKKYELEFEPYRDVDTVNQVLDHYKKLESDILKKVEEEINDNKKYNKMSDENKIKLTESEVHKRLKDQIFKDSKAASNALQIFNAKHSVAESMAKAKYNTLPTKDKKKTVEEFMAKILLADIKSNQGKVLDPILDELLLQANKHGEEEFCKYKPGIADGLDTHQKNGLINEEQTTTLKDTFNLNENPNFRFELTPVRQNLINLRKEYNELVNYLDVSCGTGRRKRSEANS